MQSLHIVTIKDCDRFHGWSFSWHSIIMSLMFDSDANNMVQSVLWMEIESFKHVFRWQNERVLVDKVKSIEIEFIQSCPKNDMYYRSPLAMCTLWFSWAHPLNHKSCEKQWICIFGLNLCSLHPLALPYGPLPTHYWMNLAFISCGFSSYLSMVIFRSNNLPF